MTRILLILSLWGALVLTARTEPPPLPAGTTEDIETAGDLTVISSDRLEYDAPKQRAIFEGSVVVSDPNLKLKANRLTVVFNEDNSVSMIVAEGKVVLSQADKRAWAEHATYDLKTGEIILDGEPRIMRGRDMLMGQKITFWRDQDRMLCEPRARLIIYPEKGAGKNYLKGSH
jgi:lipopolysaccharide export system protein LptA